MIRAKMKLESITDYGNGRKGVKFRAVCDDGTPENSRFAKYTPSGQFEMQVDNQAVIDQLTINKHYYVDFSPCLDLTGNPV